MMIIIKAADDRNILSVAKKVQTKYSFYFMKSADPNKYYI